MTLRLFSLPELVNLLVALAQSTAGSPADDDRMRRTLAVPITHLADGNRRAVLSAGGQVGSAWSANQLLAAAHGSHTCDLEAAYAFVREARDHLRAGARDFADVAALDFLLGAHFALTDAMADACPEGPATGTLVAAGRRVRAH